MHELNSAEANDVAWTQIRSVIDDALADLAADDREAVLLRYFEDHTYSEIGDTLRLNENAARMRVSRALEQLATSLARRGVKSTAAALATALAVPAALAAPANLATSITTTALVSAAAAGTTATAFTLFKVMSSAKLIATATGLAALIVLGCAVYQHKQLQVALIESAALRQQQGKLQTQLSDLKDRLATEKKHADEADADNGRLLTLIPSLLSDPSTLQNNRGLITRDTVDARFKKARDLVTNHQHEEALKEFLWCYDIGMRQVPSFLGVRGSELLTELSDLGKIYPTAFAALKDRRDESEKRVRNSNSDFDALTDYANLNRALGENEKTLALFDSFSPGDDRRRPLVANISDQLLEAQRYTELTQATMFLGSVSFFETATDPLILSKISPSDLTRFKQTVGTTTSKSIEALAGAGDVTHASELITKLLAFDNSETTRVELRKHLTRAGHLELLKTP